MVTVDDLLLHTEELLAGKTLQTGFTVFSCLKNVLLDNSIQLLVSADTK